jgi:hypothetical protein|tara:strand:+ start:652 stop:1389 length:738 start_codon:yes stop_codon:yes gene_type:complete
MSGSTFLHLTNQVLRRLNEVEIAEAAFTTVLGVQALAKDSVQNSIRQINQAEFEWPFNATNADQVLTIGQEEYSWPTNLKVADWNSFQIKKDSTLGSSFVTLRYMERDEYYSRHRDVDSSSETTGVSIPQFVFPKHGTGFGVTPSPDKAYTVNFRYFLISDDLVNDTANGATAVTRIPSQYDPTIVEGALYYMYMFRDNNEAAGLALSVFQQGIKNIQSILINKYDHITDTRVLAAKRISASSYI